jgi:fused signal recognition particle receptor
MPFWRRKKEQFVSLGLNREIAEDPVVAVPSAADAEQAALATAPEKIEPAAPATSAPWQTSVLGLDLSIEQLQAREAALEQEFSARFRRAVAATRESLSEKIDSVFAGSKRIDAALVDELEEVLIAADIGVPRRHSLSI